MHKVTTALAWIVVVALGWTGAQFHKQFVSGLRESTADRIQKYESAWQESLSQPGLVIPPHAEEFVARSPLWQHKKLRKKLAEIDARHQADYQRKLDQVMEGLLAEFKVKWEEAIEESDDPPDVGSFLERVHESYRVKLREQLTASDTAIQKKHPRTRLALDSFSGYCVLRSKEFRDKLAEQGMKLHLVDDRADYKKRIQRLQSGDTPLAVFTVDALLNAGASFDDLPGSIVLVIDETRGADAMVSHAGAIPNIDALNRRDVKIVLTPDSPSETLARVVRSSFRLPLMPKDYVVPAKDAEDVYRMFREAGPTEPKAFVLWEPYVTKLRKEYPDAHVLIDSSHFKGYIVDVLVANRAYLKKNPDEVAGLVKAYLEVSQGYQRSRERMTDLVLADAQKLAAAKKLPEALSREEAEKAVQGIWWKSTRDNFAHFGIPVSDPGEPAQTLEEIIRNLNKVLMQNGVLSKRINPEPLIDKALWMQLKEAKFDPGDGNLPAPMVTLPPVTTDDAWKRLQPVGTLQMEPILFSRGSSTIPEAGEPVLEELAGTMKTFPQYYLEIRGHALGSTDADRELAEQRAGEVVKWLQSKGGIAGPRMRSTTTQPAGDKAEASVTFVMLQASR